MDCYGRVLSLTDGSVAFVAPEGVHGRCCGGCLIALRCLRRIVQYQGFGEKKK